MKTKEIADTQVAVLKKQNASQVVELEEKLAKERRFRDGLKRNLGELLTAITNSLIGGTILIVALLEATRRSMGWPLPIIAIAFMAYAMAGPVFPGLLKHAGASWSQLVNHQYLTSQGIYGVAVGVVATYVFHFVLFGVLATRIGLQCNRGVLVTDTLQTLTDPRIYAVGECANHRGTAYGLVAPLYEQAKVCANHLADMGIGRYLGSQVSTKLKVTGIDLFSAGDFMGGEGTEIAVLRDPLRGLHKKLVFKGEALVGACLYGDIRDGAWYFDLIRAGTSVAAMRDTMVFGPPQAETA